MFDRVTYAIWLRQLLAITLQCNPNHDPLPQNSLAAHELPMRGFAMGMTRTLKRERTRFCAWRREHFAPNAVHVSGIEASLFLTNYLLGKIVSDYSRYVTSKSAAVAKVIRVPSDKATVPATGRFRSLANADCVPSAEPDPPTPGPTGEVANKASRSMVSDPDHAEIVAPGTRIAPVSSRSKPAAGTLGFDCLVLLILRTADSVTGRHGRDANA